ncbi:hypothetical protein F511_34638 [Dorcoceras hygrometricum]|uniref:Uncharacterized protein n=1 Tax=Dorcoceras hygrometricum TaxID=472368 RepID=A0A2Z7C474_9LAMI|nr:hypothetical protein F511_34638 [Dorcoceras hygrometricum]
MQHAIINAMKCMRAIENWIARPAYRLANHLKRASIPRTANRPVEIIGPSSSGPVSPSQLGGRHSNPVVTTPMIALYFSGTTHQSASHNVAPNQVLTTRTELKSTRNAHPKAHASRRFTDLTARRHSTSRSSSNADSGSLMGSKRKS